VIPESPLPLEVILANAEQQTTELIRRSVGTPEGLPLPPLPNPSMPIFKHLPIPGREYMPDVLVLPEPPSLAPPEPVLYRPRLPEPEPQPETVGSRLPPEPSWEDLLPKLPVETILLADAAESEWENYVEAEAAEATEAIESAEATE
jgi:hypothetical protein